MEQEELLEQLKKSELAQHQAMLSVCMVTENEEVIEDEQNISSVAPVDKDKDMEKFLTSLPVNEELERPTVPINSSSQIMSSKLIHMFHTYIIK